MSSEPLRISIKQTGEVIEIDKSELKKALRYLVSAIDEIEKEEAEA